MAIIAVTDWSHMLSVALNILYVAIGLGLVIFFHELGHFAVAKWCNVNVERFSIGFGPILWSRTIGETEYAFSAIPFGGYVKMLGQDDMDPSQLTSDEIALDPRSYSAKSVPQRMAIISAGVIMNVLTGVLFYAAAYGKGIEMSPSLIGSVQAGYPAWTAGLGYGDRITRINDRDVHTFLDIMRGVALTSGPVKVEGIHRDGRTFDVTLVPDVSGLRRRIGAGPMINSLRVIPNNPDKIPPTLPESPAAAANPPFEFGDVIRRVDGDEVTDFVALQQLLAEKRAKPLRFSVQRAGADANTLVDITVAPHRFRTLGLRMDIGQVSAVRDQSPAAKAGFEIGDKLLKVNGKEVGTELNPLRLPNLIADLHGQDVTIVVKRKKAGGDEQTLSLHVTPENAPGWIERPYLENVPVSIPAIGIAYHVIPSVLRVVPGSPAEKAGIQVADSIRRMQLQLPPDAPADRAADRTLTIELDSKSRNNWAHAFWMLQELPQRTVTLTLSHAGKTRTVDLQPWENKQLNWFVPDTRGLVLQPLSERQQAGSVAAALGRGVTQTRNTLVDIYLTLRNLIGGSLSYKNLHGPIGIAQAAYQIAGQGVAELLLFLGYLSVNLAVLNFLPIPVLDGGHMVFLCWEGITRKRPSERVMVAATYVGMAFVLGLMFLVIYLDIFVHGLGGK